MNALLYTIGHSRHSADKLLALLRQHDVTAVLDVRSRPYSQMNPQFNRELFSSWLREAGVSYLFLGQELGARTTDPRCYVGGKVQYELLARTPLFETGLTCVVDAVRRYRAALLCAEQDPLACHRTILVSRHLVARGLRVEHILADGSLESHEHASKRLSVELGLLETDLFRSQDEILDEAYRIRGQQIAFEWRVVPNDKTVWET